MTDTIKTRNRRFAHRHAFSLVELLVVIGILFILMALILPAVQMARESARQRQCLNHCRQFAIANQNYVTTHQKFPTYWKNAIWDSPNHKADRGLFVVLLPYLELEVLYNQFDLTTFANSPTNQAPRLSLPPIYQCPSGLGVAELALVAERWDGDGIVGNRSMTMDYAGAGRLDDSLRRPFNPKTNLGAAGARLSTIRDGLSNTILGWESSGDRRYLTVRQGTGTSTGVLVASDFNEMSEVSYCMVESNRMFCSSKRASALACVYGWGGFGLGLLSGLAPDGGRNSPLVSGTRCINKTNMIKAPFSHHPGGVNVWMADGSTRFVDEEIDSRIFALSVVIADGEITEF